MQDFDPFRGGIGGSHAPVPVRARGDLHAEAINIPDFRGLEYQYISPEEAEKALRDLMGGGINQKEDAEVDMSEAVVPGFKEGVLLLPHQVLGRAWMKEREDVGAKRLGGILADDMGLGKTIQTLTRIVEGRPHKSDRDDGWDAPTLVICPVAVMGQWASEIAKMAKGLTVIQHHGANRAIKPEILKRAHVVISTYTTVASEHSAFRFDAKDESKGKGKGKKKTDTDDSDSGSSSENFGRTLVKKAGKAKDKKDTLFRVKWWRIVLDEAHNIKNRNTKSALACCDLEAKFRWCLTGTPMQNNVEELYSLIKFLRIKPLNDWPKFKDSIAQPLKNGRGGGAAMKRLQVVLEKIMLRRQKDHVLNGKPLIDLPPRTLELVECEFDEGEKAFYRQLENKMDETVNKLMQQEKKANATSVLLLLLRLRQACNHRSLVTKSSALDFEEAKDPKSPGDDDDDDDDDGLADMFGKLGVIQKCKVCQIDLTDKVTVAGLDTHCVSCARIEKQYATRPDSTKIRKTLTLLRQIDERSGGEEKTIIFSQFTSMLDLVEPFLKDNRIAYVRYDGSMSKAQRDESLEKIRVSKRIRCILISFKAGGTGLNLTSCNNVILIDMWWNPALEDQAFDRAHRFGQTREVFIYKLMIRDTIEARILELQEKKREQARAALSGDKIKNMKIGVDDLLKLFRNGREYEDE